MIERLDAQADAVNCAEDTFFFFPQPNVLKRCLSSYRTEAFKFGKKSTGFGSNSIYMQ